MDYKNISWQVSARLAAKDQTRNALAQDVGINKRNLYLAMVGRQAFTLKMLTSLADYFKCTVDDLLADIPECYR